MLELAFDDTFVKPYHLELYHKSNQEFYMIKTSQRELIMLCIVIVDSMLKALNTHHIISLLVDLTLPISRLDHLLVDLALPISRLGPCY